MSQITSKMFYIKKIFKYIGISILVLISLTLLFLAYFNLPVSRENKEAELGVTFSSRYAADIGMNWKETYLAILDDLGVKKIRLPVYWDLVEEKEGQYDFSDIDWQLAEAEKRNADVILVVGQKVPRWPECAIPQWAKITDEKRKEALLELISVVVYRYKNKPVIKYWQVENEPFLLFGVCPKPEADLLDKEIAQVRKIDQTRPIIVSDSGELSLWMSAAKRADIFGTTMYRTIYKKGIGFFDYPIGPRFFRFKYGLINLFAKQDKTIVVELQAEPWVSGWTVATPLKEQFQSMNAKKLVENVTFARQTGFPRIYLWGAEWWYWLKTEKNHSELWETAKTLFN